MNFYVREQSVNDTDHFLKISFSFLNIFYFTISTRGIFGQIAENISKKYTGNCLLGIEINQLN